MEAALYGLVLIALFLVLYIVTTHESRLSRHEARLAAHEKRLRTVEAAEGLETTVHDTRKSQDGARISQWSIEKAWWQRAWEWLKQRSPK